MSDAATRRAHSAGARELGVHVTGRYLFEWVALRILIRALFSIRVEGLHHWPQAPFQMVANHHSGWDPMLILAVSPLRPRVTWFGPKEADFSKGFLNRLIGFFGGAIPFHPKHTNLMAATRAVRRVFDADGVLAITPEGTLGFPETELLPFQEGATMFASMSGVPLLPCVVIGSSTLYLRRRVVVRFGEPIASVTAEGRVEREVLAARVRAAMEALLPDEEPMISRWRFGEQMSDWFILRSQVGPRKAYVEERLRAQATARTEAGGRG